VPTALARHGRTRLLPAWSPNPSICGRNNLWTLKQHVFGPQNNGLRGRLQRCPARNASRMRCGRGSNCGQECDGLFSTESTECTESIFLILYILSNPLRSPSVFIRVIRSRLFLSLLGPIPVHFRHRTNPSDGGHGYWRKNLKKFSLNRVEEIK
jgi:hypothetical protein